MVHVEALLNSFRKDHTYTEFSFRALTRGDGMWHAFPDVSVFMTSDASELGEQHAAVIMHGSIAPGGRYYLACQLFYPDYDDPSGKPWFNLLNHIEVSGGLLDAVDEDCVSAKLLLNTLETAPFRHVP